VVVGKRGQKASARTESVANAKTREFWELRYAVSNIDLEPKRHLFWPCTAVIAAPDWVWDLSVSIKVICGVSVGSWSWVIKTTEACARFNLFVIGTGELVYRGDWPVTKAAKSCCSWRCCCRCCCRGGKRREVERRDEKRKGKAGCRDMMDMMDMMDEGQGCGREEWTYGKLSNWD